MGEGDPDGFRTAKFGHAPLAGSRPTTSPPLWSARIVALDFHLFTPSVRSADIVENLAEQVGGHDSSRGFIIAR